MTKTIAALFLVLFSKFSTGKTIPSNNLPSAVHWYKFTNKTCMICCIIPPNVEVSKNLN